MRVLLLILLIPYAAVAASQVVSVRSPAANATFINQDAPTTDYSALDSIVVDRVATGGGRVMRMLVRPDLFGIPRGVTVNSAICSLKTKPTVPTTTSTISAYQVNRYFIENGVTWNVWTTAQNWATAGGDYSDLQSAVSVTAADTWYTWNVTAAMQKQVDVDSCGGLLFALTDEGTNQHASFWSDDAVDSLRPRVWITFTVPASGTLIFGGTGLLDTVAVKDNVLNNSTVGGQAHNQGGRTTVFIGRSDFTGSTEQRGLWWFDVSLLPEAATISEGWLRLWCSYVGTNARSFVTDSTKQDWVEGSINGRARQDGSSCWLGRGFTISNPNGLESVGGTSWADTDSAWSVIGGGAKMAGDTLTFTNGTVGEFDWDVTGQATDLYHTQVMGTSATGFGIRMYCTLVNVINHTLTTQSSEHINHLLPAKGPRLVVTYDSPPSASRSQVIFVSED